MDEYHFKVKIGDAERPFDVVAAYWDTDDFNTEIKTIRPLQRQHTSTKFGRTLLQR